MDIETIPCCEELCVHGDAVARVRAQLPPDEQLYDLAMLSNCPLEPDAMGKFVARSNQIMMLLAK